MKTITGCLAILLGFVGLLVALAAIAGAWWGAKELAARATPAMSQANQSLSEVEEGFARTQAQVEATVEAMDQVRRSAASIAKIASDAASRPEVERIRNQLLQLLERTDLVREVLPPIASALDNTAGIVEQSSPGGSFPGRIRAVAGNVRSAAELLEEVRRKAAPLRDSDARVMGAQIAELAERARASLASLSNGLGEAKDMLASIRGDLPEVQQKIDKWKIYAPAILTGLLLWFALGQLAIVAWGRRRLAARTPPTGTPTA